MNYNSLLPISSHSSGELAGLHRRAGASRTSGSTASAQTPHQTAAVAAGHNAADKLHVRAPENNSCCSAHYLTVDAVSAVWVQIFWKLLAVYKVLLTGLLHLLLLLRKVDTCNLLSSCVVGCKASACRCLV